ncbi:MAG TPA: alpha/beta hydrolase [Rhodobiaceae bacterium]|jgi:haloalkane dehalogenase|nr:alpha/beta hydrolase [Rhodobiaceae bacterium]
MIEADETFNGTWPFKPHFSKAAGFKQHYVDEGPKGNKGEVILCLHGEPTWGYLYRHMIPGLSAHYRVVVPDHMGFGKSETPQDRDYTLQTHVENLTAFIEDLSLSDITLVIQDWGGPMGAAFAIRHPDKVKRLVVMNTLTGYGGVTPRPERTPWFEWIAKHEEAGTLRGVLGELGTTVLSIMKLLGFENSAAVDRDWLNAYQRPFPDRASCIGGIEFPLDVHYGRFLPFVVEGLKTGNLEKLQAKPAMMAQGLQDRAIWPENAMADFKAIWPDAPITTFDNAGHFIQEDVPQALVSLIHQFMQIHK